MNLLPWTQTTYESSVTRLCWRDSAYAQGWDACPALAADDELRQIVEMEHELEAVPEWARRIVVDSLHSLPGCGHYLYPLAFLEIVEAIGAERPQTFVHGCYTVARARKREMMDVVFCLDGWLAGADRQDVARELNALGYRRLDWDAVCADLWEVLGEHEELKDRLVERLILLQRWAIKKTAWENDRASQFGRDRYLGPYSETPGRDGVSRWTHADPPVPDFDIHASPRLQRLEARISALHPGTPVPGWGGDHLYCGWLCAPKAFRYLERIVWEIGGGRNVRKGERVPGFLRCEDTWPDLAGAATWWHAYLAALDGWWRGAPEQRAVAGQVYERLSTPTPVKRWLVRLLRHHLRLAETVWWADRLQEGKAGGKSGTRPLLGIGDWGLGIREPTNAILMARRTRDLGMVRIALLADIHGNSVALDAVLDDIEQQGGADELWILGDIVALGPAPVEVLERLLAIPNLRCVRGNTERYVCTGDRPPPSPDEARATPVLLQVLVEVAGTFAWTQGAVSQAGRLEELSRLPLEQRTVLPDGTRMLGVHASPGRDDGPSFAPDYCQIQMKRLLADCDADLVCVGHTHRPMDGVIAGTRVVNPGSVSNPASATDGPPDLRASYALLEASLAGVSIKHRRVDYDREAVVASLQRLRHPGAAFIIQHLRGQYKPT